MISFMIINLQGQNRPNILLLIADDMGTDAFSPYNIGVDQPHTPVLNSMMSEGILFMNAWGYPLCAPSRASLITGRYGNKNGVMRIGPNLPVSEVTIFEHLSTITNDEYADALFGKWQLGGADNPNNQGVDYYAGNSSPGFSDYYNWRRTINGVTDMSDTYLTTYLTDEAINWVDNQEKPWFLWMAYNTPHSPYHLPPDSLYTRTQTTSSTDMYMCMIESLDHEVGRLYNSLTQEEKDSTIIIFIGDNGTPNTHLQGYPRRQGKGSLYEGGVRVPMFVTGYGVERVNEQEDALVSFTDILATLTELLGVDLPGGIDNSFSFYPLLSNATADARKYNYSEVDDEGVDRAIRNDQYKLIIRDDGSQEVYDLVQDPLEEVDIARGLTADQMLIVAELKAEADSIFTSWSCNDGIQNGDEEDIDCGGSSCQACLTTSVEKITDDSAIKLYPNPTDQDLVIEVASGSFNIRILDISGKPHMSISIDQTQTIDTSNLPLGLYFLEIINVQNREISVQTFLKQ